MESTDKTPDKTHAGKPSGSKNADSKLQEAINARQQAESALRESQEFLQAALIAANTGIVRKYLIPDSRLDTDAFTDSSKDWSFNISHLFGYPPGHQLTAEQVAARFHPEDLKAAVANMERALQSGKDEDSFEYRVIWPDGSIHWLMIRSSFYRDNEGRPLYYTGTLFDITELKEARAHIEHLATHDNLTGLPNRCLFSELSRQVIATAQRHDRRFAVLFIDLDGFKTVNDTFGHAAGDQVLQEIAKRLRACLRSSDIVARLGGDEFIILLNEIHEKEDASRISREILGSIQKPMAITEATVTLKASIGIACYPDDGRDEQSLLRHADTAMYRAKSCSKNKFYFY